MTTIAQQKNITNYIEAFLLDHGSEEMVEMWQGKENMKSFTQVLKKATKKISAKKLKDPSKPKRGKSAYLYFCAANRAQVKEDLGDNAKATEVTSELGVRWQEFKASNKAKDKKSLKSFEDDAAIDKQRYIDEMEGYEAPSDEELELLQKKKKKSKAKKKDPNKPKRGKSSYLFFCADKRAGIKEDLGDDAKATDVTVQLGVRWNELKEDDDRADEMAVYVEQATEDKARYEDEMKDYTPQEDDEYNSDDGKKAAAPKAKKNKAKARKKKVEKKSEKKKPKSGFTNFCKEHRDKVKKENFDMKAMEVTKKLKKMWMALCTNEKKEWALE